MGPALAIIAGLTIGSLIAVLLAVEVMTRRTPRELPRPVLDVRGPPDDPSPDDDVIDLFDPAPDDASREAIYEVYEPQQLLDVDHLRGMDAIDELLQTVAAGVVEARGRSRRRPRRPTAILLHGPPGSAMTVLAHVFARQFGAHLVRIFASRTIAESNGGSQPMIALAVDRARHRLPSVLLVDELDEVIGPDVKDTERQRAANDLLNECLRPAYGTSHVVVASFTSYDDAVPRLLEQAFEHVVRVDVPELERAVLLTAIRSADGALFRSLSRKRPAERADARRCGRSDKAA